MVSAILILVAFVIPTVHMAIQDLLEPDINENITHP
jgi:hypothetical protein